MTSGFVSEVQLQTKTKTGSNHSPGPNRYRRCWLLTLMLGYRKFLLKILTLTNLIVYKIIDIIYIFYAVTVCKGTSLFHFKVLVKSYFWLLNDLVLVNLTSNRNHVNSKSPIITIILTKSKKLGMWRSSISNSTTFDLCTFLADSKFDE